jgi:adenosylmethionine-8-amino-7-oxononanoate aminotransferase
MTAIRSLENVLAKKAGEMAAIIVEPLVQGAAGMAMYHPVYLANCAACATSIRYI